MKYIIKLIICLFSFALGNELSYTDDYIISVILYIIGGIFTIVLIIDLANILRDFGLWSNNGYTDSNDGWNDYWNYYGNNDKTITYNKSYSQVDTVKKIEEKSAINNNIIEIGNEKEIIIDDEELVVDNTKSNKPKIHKSAFEHVQVEIYPKKTAMQKKEATSHVTKAINKSDCIFVNNGSDLDRSTEKVYKVLLCVFKKQVLTANQKYALLQSIFYVDVYSSNVIIYVDKNILTKSGLTEEHLQKEKTAEYIKKILHDDKLKIIYEDIEYKNLLNFYLERKQL